MSNLNNYNSEILSEFSDSLSSEEALRIEKKMLLAARIDKAMRGIGWLGKDLAKALNKSPSEISKWLSGTHNFTTDTLWDIEKVLDIELILLDVRGTEFTAVYNYSAGRKIKNIGLSEPSYMYYDTRIFKSESKSARPDKLIETSDFQVHG